MSIFVATYFCCFLFSDSKIGVAKNVFLQNKIKQRKFSS